MNGENGNYNNSVNKSNAYYNYYMYLSNHTKTNYSSINIDEYIRNNLGIKQGEIYSKIFDNLSVHKALAPTADEVKKLKTTSSCISKHKHQNGRSSQICLMVKKSHSLQTHQTIENDAIGMKITFHCQKNESNRLYLISIHSSKIN